MSEIKLNQQTADKIIDKMNELRMYSPPGEFYKRFTSYVYSLVGEDEGWTTIGTTDGDWVLMINRPITAEERNNLINWFGIKRDSSSLVSEDEYLPITEEVHAWDRPLTRQEIDERYELQKSGKISVVTCDCDLCKQTRTEIALRMIEKYCQPSIQRARYPEDSRYTIPDLVDWLTQQKEGE